MTDFRKYQLPQELGGRTLEGVDMGTGIVDFPVCGEKVSIPLILLTEAKPPLPPEPQENRSVWMFTLRDVPQCTRIYQRIDALADNGWDNANRRWFTPGTGASEPRGRGLLWSDIASLPGTWVRMVPDPAHGAPELPFREADGDVDSDELAISTGRGKVELQIAGEFWIAPPDLARAAAKAIWRAADEAEAA